MSRIRGFVKKIGSIISSLPEKLYVSSYEKYAARIKCSKCGKVFIYRGLEDSASVAGMIYDPDTDSYIAVPGTADAICDTCKSKLSGGPLDGKTTGDLYNETDKECN